jgi:hypothetical protein
MVVSLQTSGQVESFTVLTPEQVRGILEKIRAGLLEALSKSTPLRQFLQWNISCSKNRTVSPFSNLSVTEWIENRIKGGPIEGLQAAILVDPANARLAAHYGRRLADRALEKAIDPDEARRARGEADFQTRRALELAFDNNEVQKLRAEVVKLLQLPK